MGDGTVERVLKRIAQICPSAQHVSTLRKEPPSTGCCSKHLTQTSTKSPCMTAAQLSFTGLPSSSQFAATFLLGCTRSARPASSGCRHALGHAHLRKYWPPDSAMRQVIGRELARFLAANPKDSGCSFDARACARFGSCGALAGDSIKFCAASLFETCSTGVEVAQVHGSTSIPPELARSWYPAALHPETSAGGLPRYRVPLPQRGQRGLKCLRCRSFLLNAGQAALARRIKATGGNRRYHPCDARHWPNDPVPISLRDGAA